MPEDDTTDIPLIPSSQGLATTMAWYHAYLQQQQQQQQQKREQ